MADTTANGSADAGDAATTALRAQGHASSSGVPLPPLPPVDELDDFGLPIRKFAPPPPQIPEPGSPSIPEAAADKKAQQQQQQKNLVKRPEEGMGDDAGQSTGHGGDCGIASTAENEDGRDAAPPVREPPTRQPVEPHDNDNNNTYSANEAGGRQEADEGEGKEEDRATDEARDAATATATHNPHRRDTSTASTSHVMSEFSHQSLTAKDEEKAPDDDGGWQTMPSFAPYDIYDDDNRLVAREHNEEDDETYGYAGLGGAGKGYTRVIMDEDAQSATSMDDDTNYLFREGGAGTSAAAAAAAAAEDDDQQRDAATQLQATKDLLTEGQKIAYVGLTRLEISEMVKEAEGLGLGHSRRSTRRKEVRMAADGFRMWGQKMMIRLYAHMDISAAEQVMIEQLGQHGVAPRDLTPVLMANARVKNPMAAAADKGKDEDKDKDKNKGKDKNKDDDGDKNSETGSLSLGSPTSSTTTTPVLPRYSDDDDDDDDDQKEESLPAYEAAAEAKAMTGNVQTPSSMPTTAKIDIDIRWTVLCDLFLVLIADSIYDSRSRVLLQRVARSLEISWVGICRFEKKVTDALEMQQEAEKENWNEEDHMNNRRKLAQRRRYVMMGLATLGGGLVIGLSAGLLAPVIGAGLAAGFTTIGVVGTNGFLAGSAGAAIITSSAAASGGYIGGKAANKRTGAVRTFEYRPLHNNKRVNLVITVSGWLTGKVDDVRLPFSTVDPVMGDLYSVLWEPDILRSIGDTINILATEALTQGLQQILGSTILMSLMAALQLPIVLTKLSYLIDNPWAVSLDRATAAGLILADSLIDRNLGARPITLVGYSLGSRVIHSCLQELARKGAYGLVQNVYLFGSPIVVKRDEYLRARTVVPGRFVNGYNRNDWILGYLFRLTSGGIRRIAGLAPIDEAPWIENVDVTEFVKGHMDYRRAMPRLLRECGWMVESDEFTEIEDPDPENHAERQRELINEIEEARKGLDKEKRQSKGMFGFLGRKKRAEKQEWEVYGGDESKAAQSEGGNAAGAAAASAGATGAAGAATADTSVLFDVDAIRAELSREVRPEDLSVREIPSTLPPMKLDIHSPQSGPATPTPTLTPTPTPTRYEPRASHERTPTMPASSTLPYHQRRAASESYYAAHDDSLEDEIQMSFEPAPAWEGQGARSPTENLAGGHFAERPGMTTGKTVPDISMPDPWADLDDEDFGKEQEIRMTFA